ncbi:MAG: hypothetical protein JRJ02_15725 [Deltaproteobacteria bacterium]|nr:hypothetical protein [Deltaproteobacteria bacterium]
MDLDTALMVPILGKTRFTKKPRLLKKPGELNISEKLNLAAIPFEKEIIPAVKRVNTKDGSFGKKNE